MTQYKNHFTVLKTEYLNCSVYGNPKKLLVLRDDCGAVHLAKTATNALCGYMTYYTDKRYLFKYHYTRNGNMIIDYCENYQ